MHMKHSLFILAVMSLLFLGSCASDDSLSELTPEPKPETPTIPFTGTISFGDNPSAVIQAAMADPSPRFKALSDEEVKVAATWEVGDELALVIDGTVTKATVSEVKDGKAYISARVVSTVSDGADARFIYPYTAVDQNTGQVKENLLAEQDGKLETIAKQFDVCEGSGKLSVYGGAAVVQEDITMLEKFSIMRFETRLANDNSPLNVRRMQIEQGDDTYHINLPSPAYQSIYVILKPFTAMPLDVWGLPDPDGVAYKKSAPNATLLARKFYRSTLKMTIDDMWFPYKNTFYMWDAKKWVWDGVDPYITEFGDKDETNYPTAETPDRYYNTSGITDDPGTAAGRSDAQYSAKDMPCLNAMGWYMKHGDAYVDFQTVYRLNGQKLTGGVWLKKWNKISEKPAGATITSCSSQHPDLQYNGTIGGVRYGETLIRNSGAPNNSDDYFFLPAIGDYNTDSERINEGMGFYWSSSIKSDAYSHCFWYDIKRSNSPSYLYIFTTTPKKFSCIGGHRPDGSAWFK